MEKQQQEGEQETKETVHNLHENQEKEPNRKRDIAQRRNLVDH